MRTGHYGLSLDSAQGGVRRLGYLDDGLSYEEAAKSDSNSAITNLPALKMDYAVISDGTHRFKRFNAIYRAANMDTYNRMYECGRYMQHHDLMEMVFEGLGAPGHVEVFVMPEYLSLGFGIYPANTMRQVGFTFSLTFEQDITSEANRDGSVVCVRFADGSGYSFISTGSDIAVGGNTVTITGTVEKCKENTFSGISVLIVPSKQASLAEGEAIYAARNLECTATVNGKETPALYDSNGYENGTFDATYPGVFTFSWPVNAEINDGRLVFTSGEFDPFWFLFSNDKFAAESEASTNLRGIGIYVENNTSFAVPMMLFAAYRSEDGSMAQYKPEYSVEYALYDLETKTAKTVVSTCPDIPAGFKGYVTVDLTQVPWAEAWAEGDDICFTPGTDHLNYLGFNFLDGFYMTSDTQSFVLDNYFYYGKDVESNCDIDLSGGTPTTKPTQEPTKEPTQAPTEEPTEVPTEEPTEEPTEALTEAPTEVPTEKPTEAPTAGNNTPAPVETKSPAESKAPDNPAGNSNGWILWAAIGAVVVAGAVAAIVLVAKKKK